MFGKKLFVLLMTAVMSVCMVLAVSGQEQASGDKDPSIAILFTNDVHSYYNRDIGYDGLILYKKELQQEYEHVLLVDAGDAIQGAPIGAISKGKEVIRIMNEAGYDVAVLGNHEFDYGLEVLDDLSEQLLCGYTCANFCTADGASVFAPYKTIECGDTLVGFVGVVTPETYTKSYIHELIDDQGNAMYDLKNDDSGESLYACLQSAIDELKERGADFVILIAHLGNDDNAVYAFHSKEVAAHLTGLGAIIDAHSHKVYNDTVKDASGKEIPLVQTGAYFQNVGKMILHLDGTIDTALIDEIPAPEEWMEGVDAVTVTRGQKERYVDADMNRFLEDITASYADTMNRRVGEVAFDMDVRNEEGDISRSGENGMCDLVADAYREIMETEIGFVNAGSVRNGVQAGELTFNDMINVLPYSNDVVIARVKGQTLLDALELGCSYMPLEAGGFPQVSGMEYTLDMSMESTVQTDENGNYVKVAGDRRVRDVLIDGEPLDPDAEYTVAMTEYIFNGGDHYEMFSENSEIIGTTRKTDNAILTEYVENNLNGVIPETYLQVNDRIHIINQAGQTQ